jgi:hypothetical protein
MPDFCAKQTAIYVACEAEGDRKVKVVKQTHYTPTNIELTILKSCL